MPRLLLINGLPGSGKSTLARRYVDDHPLALALDIDMVVAMLGSGPGGLHDVWPAARRLALEMARVHLEDGLDVVVPQFLGAPEYLLQLEATCRDAGATIAETVLHAPSPGEAARRFRERAARAETAQHRDAPLGLPGRGSDAEFAEMETRLARVVQQRPHTHVVEPVHGDVEATYAALLAAIADRG